jgi:hypothetical protein
LHSVSRAKIAPEERSDLFGSTVFGRRNVAGRDLVDGFRSGTESDEDNDRQHGRAQP